jgi:hypothetical protein
MLLFLLKGWKRIAVVLVYMSSSPSYSAPSILLQLLKDTLHSVSYQPIVSKSVCMCSKLPSSLVYSCAAFDIGLLISEVLFTFPTLYLPA